MRRCAVETKSQLQQQRNAAAQCCSRRGRRACDRTVYRVFAFLRRCSSEGRVGDAWEGKGLNW